MKYKTVMYIIWFLWIILGISVLGYFYLNTRGWIFYNAFFLGIILILANLLLLYILGILEDGEEYAD